MGNTWAGQAERVHRTKKEVPHDVGWGTHHLLLRHVAKIHVVILHRVGVHALWERDDLVLVRTVRWLAGGEDEGDGPVRPGEVLANEQVERRRGRWQDTGVGVVLDGGHGRQVRSRAGLLRRRAGIREQEQQQQQCRRPTTAPVRWGHHWAALLA